MVNGLNAVEIVVGGVSGAAFGSIFDGITAVLRNASEFTTSHTNIKSTLEALQPLIREIEGKNNRLLLQDEELKDLKKEIEAGLKRVQELSEKSVWNYCMRPLYKKELDGMDESLKRLLRILQVQGVRDVKEVLVQVNDCKTDVSKISIQLDDCKTEIVEEISDLTKTVRGLVERIIGPSSFVPTSEKVASLVEEDALGSSLLTMRHAVDEALSKPNPHYNIIFRIEEALRRVIEELGDADENRKLEEGTELILKCSNVVEWTDRKKVKYADKLDDLVKFLEAFGQRLKRTNSTMPEGFDTQNSIPCIKSSVDCAEQIADCPEETEEMNQGFPVSRAQGEWRRAESIGVSRRGALTWLRQMLIFKKSNRPTDDVNGLRNDLSVFSYSSILAATNNFAEENKLGEGGFGPVYKGKLAWGQEIAVKRLSKCSGQGTSEFKNELILKELQHTNVVQLFGFCIHGEEKMLIYEYLQNKSLGCFLFDPTRGLLLDWKKRFSILEGIAQGLLYLHKYSRKKVIHRDLKPSNILLDENMNPKISDFGLAMIFTQNGLEANTSRIVGTSGYMNPKISNFDMARIFIHDEYVTHITTMMAGTRGYMPPEAMMGMISVKSDVYSFGVLILEIISGRKNNNFYNGDHTLNLVGYAWELWKEGAGLELMDPTLGDSFIKEQLLRCIHVGLLCVEEDAADRPNMSDVVTMLINESLPLAPPTKPFYVGRRTVESQTDISWSQQSEFVASANYMSISDFESR